MKMYNLIILIKSTTESRAALLPHIVSQILFVVMCIVIGAFAFLIHRSARCGRSTSMWLRDEGVPFHIEDWGYHHGYWEERRKKDKRRDERLTEG